MRLPSIPLVLAVAFSTKPHVVHIGAHTGNDPTRYWVREHKWTATLIEPDPTVCNVLKQRYEEETAGGSVAVGQGAAGCDKGSAEVTFWSGSRHQASLTGDVAFTGKGGYLSQLGALNRGSGASRLAANEYIEHMELINVTCFSPAHILESLRPSQAGPEQHSPLAVVIDAEGEDSNIVNQLIFESGLRPHVLMYEEEHEPLESRRRLREMLGSWANYECVSVDSSNAICFQNNHGSPLGFTFDEARLMFAPQCWCPVGFGREPFPVCGDDPPVGCTSHNGSPVLVSSIETALLKLHAERPSWWAVPSEPGCTCTVPEISSSWASTKIKFLSPLKSSAHSAALGVKLELSITVFPYLPKTLSDRLTVCVQVDQDTTQIMCSRLGDLLAEGFPSLAFEHAGDHGIEAWVELSDDPGVRLGCRQADAVFFSVTR